MDNRLLLCVCVLFCSANAGMRADAAPGDLDTSFGSNGVVVTDIGVGTWQEFRAVDIQPDGKIVALGSATLSTDVEPCAFAVVRYLPDGSLDRTFSEDGIVTTLVVEGFSPPGYVIPPDLVMNQGFDGFVQPDGRIVVAGDVGSMPEYFASVLLRYLPSGHLDVTFSEDGISITDVACCQFDTQAAIQADGRIVCAGLHGSWAGHFGGWLARYHTDGTLDGTFSDDGMAVNAGGNWNDVALQADGRMVVAGTHWNGTNRDIVVARYLSDGTLDSTFGENGVVTAASGDYYSWNPVAIQQDGKILVAGRGSSWSGILRYNTNGSPDTSFSEDGIAEGPTGYLAIQSDGKIVVAGTVSYYSARDIRVARYNTDGTLDTSFSNDGVVDVSVRLIDRAYGVALQPDGKIVVVGNTASSWSQVDFMTLRLHGGTLATTTTTSTTTTTTTTAATTTISSSTTTSTTTATATTTTTTTTTTATTASTATTSTTTTTTTTTTSSTTTTAWNGTVSVLDSSGMAGSQVAVPIVLSGDGGVNAMGFSVVFDVALLTYVDATAGSDLPAGTIMHRNEVQARSGRLGIVLGLPVGQILIAGTQELIVVTFDLDAAAPPGSTTPVVFSDDPVPREVVDVHANVLPAAWADGTVSIVCGYEADVTPRPGGNDRVTVSDWVQIGRFAAGLDTVIHGCEFTKADCAPRPCGNGRISVSDWVQAGRYAARLDSIQEACGPTSPSRP
ncbi:hypothetical protein ACFLSJ_07840 [Verrucomicrobiota bacterium]